jgi:hypothetical protein
MKTIAVINNIETPFSVVDMVRRVKAVVDR